MTKYIVKMIIDRWPVGEDVTGRYTPEVARRLVTEGYLEAVTVDAAVAKPKKDKVAAATNIEEGAH